MGYVKALILAFGLVAFSLIAFIIAVLSIPMVLANPSYRYRLNHLFVTPFGLFARALVGIEIDVIHGERMRGPTSVFIGNHQSGMDLAVIGYVCQPGTLIVGKKELLTIPIFGWFFALAGNLLIDRKNPEKAKAQMTHARKVMLEHRLHLAVFPEGTRSKDQSILPFKKGAFYIAMEMKLPIVPVVCSNLKGIGIWEKGELSGGKAIISVLPPVPMDQVTMAELPQVIDRIRNDMIAEYQRINSMVHGAKMEIAS